jgi:16S rRNA G966 N2-methylase RsmD
MKPACAYQGGKAKYASAIVETIGLPRDCHFYDLCCGSGAVSIEAVRRGQKPSSITMVDAGPWGMFWKAIGEGSFQTWKLERLLSLIPENPFLFQMHIEQMASLPISEMGGNEVYTFVILQAASFANKAVWIDGDYFRHPGIGGWIEANGIDGTGRVAFNSTALVRRVSALVKGMRGVVGMRANINDLIPDGIRDDAIVYIDPPYRGTTDYGHEVAGTIGRKVKVPCWVSEGEPLSDKAILLDSRRTQAAMIASRKNRKNNVEEWLSYFGP